MALERIMPNAENASESELLVAAQASVKFRESRRFQAIRALILGYTHEQVAQLYGVTVRAVVRWVGFFNDSGIDGLVEKPRSGRPRKVSPAEVARLKEVVQNPALAGRVHWTGRGVHGWLREDLQREVGYRTIIRLLHEIGFRLKVPQPWPDRQDDLLRAEYLERLRRWLEDEQIDLWFMDEMGVEGDPRPRRRWAQRGEKTRVTKNGDHIRMNVTGMVCPRTGQFYALEFSHSDGEIFQYFLDHANAELTFQRPRNILICDNASWHKRKSLAWGRFEAEFLPPYSPDFNPIERLWLLIKAQWFTDFIAKTRDQLMERLDQALCWVIDRATLNQQTCRIKTEL